MVAKSVAALDGDRELFDRILIEEIKVDNGLITVQNFRWNLLGTFHEKNLGAVLEDNYNTASTLESRNVVAVLNSLL